MIDPFPPRTRQPGGDTPETPLFGRRAGRDRAVPAAGYSRAVPAPSTRPGLGAVAIWTSADLPGLGDQLLGRVVQRELLDRLPGWRTTLLAALGRHRPSVTDGGVVAEPLGVRSAVRVAQLARASTLSVLCPAFALDPDEIAARYPGERADAATFFTDGLGADAEPAHPVLPFAVRVAEPVPVLARAAAVSVRDRESAGRLAAAGVDADLVPHPALLLGGVVDLATMPERARALRLLDVLPEGDYAVLALGEGAVPGPAELAALAGLGLPMVVLPVGEVAPPPLPGVPADLVLEDRLAVLAAARAVIATDEHTAAAAAGAGARWVLVDPAGGHRAPAAEFGLDEQLLTSFGEVSLAAAGPGRPGAARAVAAAFDRLAELAEQACPAGEGELTRRHTALAGENAALRHAHLMQRQRILTERRRLAEPLARAWLDRDAALAEAAALRAANDELARRNEELAARLAACERELAAWQHTKLVRWTRPLRDAYGKVRG